MSSFVYLTPLGAVTLSENGEGLTSLVFGAVPLENPVETPLLRDARSQLLDYLDGSRGRFELPTAPEGTAFQLKIWAALLEIPYGGTLSYSRLADAAGVPRSCRAAANACGANPLPIFIPCHRVIRSDGSLGGYSCGIEIKKKLLAIEKGCNFEKPAL